MERFPKMMFAVATAFVLFTTPAMAQSADEVNMKILAEKIKSDKKLVVAMNLDLTSEETEHFWPLYDAYQAELDQLNQRLGKLIEEYSHAYNKGEVSETLAAKLITKSITYESDELQLRASYVRKFAKVLPPKKIARYLQMENKIRAVVRFELAKHVPLIY